jgi:hypothetical protein
LTGGQDRSAQRAEGERDHRQADPAVTGLKRYRRIEIEPAEPLARGIDEVGLLNTSAGRTDCAVLATIGWIALTRMVGCDVGYMNAGHGRTRRSS